MEVEEGNLRSAGRYRHLFSIAAALITMNGLSATAVLVATGVFYILSGSYFRIPMPVQPLKVLSVIAIASHASPALIAASAYSRNWLHFGSKPGRDRRSGSEIKYYVDFDRGLRACVTRQRARLYLKIGVRTRVLRTLLPKMCFTCRAAVVVLVPVLWLWHKSGEPELSDSLGLHLFNRVVAEQQQLDEAGPATKTFLTLLEGKDPRGVPFWEIREQGRLLALSYSEQETPLRKVSFEGIRKDPWAHLISPPRLAWKMLAGDPSDWIAPWGNTISSYPRLENPPLLAFTASTLRIRWHLEGIHRMIWPILCWMAVAGTFLGLLLPQGLTLLALAWIPAGYLLSSTFVEYFNPRFNSAVVPFVAALTMIPLGFILTSSTVPPAEPHNEAP